ncbi:MAG: GGDEF domain-containing protein [Myxococcales bacterium]|nr:GGDEF domain-containing protein [Myxococcales bacterium]
MSIEAAVLALTELASAGSARDSLLAMHRASNLLGEDVKTYRPLLECLARQSCELDQLRRLAGRDALTGVANRRCFQESLEREQARAERQGECFALVLLDLDGLKAINDTHGHAAGDTVIVAVAEACTASVRSSDVVARLGGDEFAIIMVGANGEGARASGERIRAAIEAVETPFGRPRISVGVAASDEIRAGEDSLFERADRELYRDKAGRKAEAQVA